MLQPRMHINQNKYGLTLPELPQKEALMHLAVTFRVLNVCLHLRRIFDHKVLWLL